MGKLTNCTLNKEPNYTIQLRNKMWHFFQIKIFSFWNSSFYVSIYGFKPVFKQKIIVLFFQTKREREREREIERIL